MDPGGDCGAVRVSDGATAFSAMIAVTEFAKSRPPPLSHSLSLSRLQTHAKADSEELEDSEDENSCGGSHHSNRSGRDRSLTGCHLHIGNPRDGGGGGSSPGGTGAGAMGRGRGMGSIFYKTKLCSRFRNGNCPYNTNCNFAHGMEELRKPPPGWEEFVASQELPPPLPSSQSPSQGGGGSGAGRGSSGAAGATDSQVRFYKTRPCKKYFGEANCPYGEKCNFLHDEQSVPRVVREAREAAVAAAAAAAAAAVASPNLETLNVATNGNMKEAGGSTPAASGNSNARPPNWKTRLCNKWETTGYCPFGDKCHFAHGRDELQRYRGGLLDPNAPTPALSDSKSGGTPSRDTGAVSSYYSNGPNQRHQGGAFSAKDALKGNNSKWRGPTEISTIYGDWVEEEEWEFGLTTTGGREGFEHDGDAG